MRTPSYPVWRQNPWADFFSSLNVELGWGYIPLHFWFVADPSKGIWQFGTVNRQIWTRNQEWEMCYVTCAWNVDFWHCNVPTYLSVKNTTFNMEHEIYSCNVGGVSVEITVTSVWDLLPVTAATFFIWNDIFHWLATYTHCTATRIRTWLLLARNRLKRTGNHTIIIHVMCIADICDVQSLCTSLYFPQYTFKARLPSRTLLLVW